MVLARFSFFARDLYNISLTRELFPEPDTPVTQVITPRGISTSTFFRLFSLAPRTFSQPVGCRRSGGTGMDLRPLKYAPVMESSHFMIS